MNTTSEVLILLLFAIGGGDGFRCYANAFVKAGGMKNWFVSHLYGTFACALRFSIYVVAIAIVVNLSQAFG